MSANSRLSYIISAGVLTLASLFVWPGCSPESDFADLPEQVDFNLHIKPILSDRCFKCHGPDNNTREASLRLDTEEGALHTELSSGGFAIKPGSARRSELYRRITSDDPETRMPPPESNLALSPREIALIERWIEQGAEWKRHWAFLPPETPRPPDVQHENWVRSDLDRFVLARIESEGLEPSPEADRETLLRRVSLDLTGLPPTIEDLDAFLSDTSPEAYERAVDRLLDSPHYGERMAVEWLDVARYADSHGYQDDGIRTMWPWRDWVIEAFNENLPFDEFVTWQMAGDLLPNPTRKQLLATGFHRNHMQSQEGGIVPEEYRVEYVADRVQSTSKTFLGLTMECARCHDHKYDPVSQEDYFGLFAFFNNINEAGNIPYAGEASPTLTLPDEETEQRLAALRERMAAADSEADVRSTAYDEDFEKWLADVQLRPDDHTVRPSGLVAAYPLDAVDDEHRLRNTTNASRPALIEGDRDFPPLRTDGHAGDALTLTGTSWVDAGDEIGRFERNESFSISLWFRIETAGTEGPLFARTSGMFNGNRGYVCVLNADGTISASLNHVFPDNTIEIRTRDAVEPGTWHHIVMTYDGSSLASGMSLYLDGKKTPSDIIVDRLQQSILYTRHAVTGERTNWGDSGRLRIGFMGPNQTKLDSVSVDELQVFNRRLTAPEVAALNGQPDPLAALLATDQNQPTAGQREDLRDYYVTRLNTAWRSAANELSKLRAEENDIMTEQIQVMILRERSQTRPTFVLARGAYDAPAEPVERGTPSALMDFPDDLEKTRLGLARWITDPQNPLPARVTVNRYWQMLFGRGLVATPDDFGNQGALPSHPLLLDWLATNFVESGWDVKELLKRIVTSATYRQSSLAAAELRDIDPDNELLARGPSRRLTAEALRDQALAASGLLVRDLGGPPVKPYQPEGLWEELATRNETTYEQDTGDKLYRRSLYTIWKRTTPPPSMMNFDATERNFCTVRRQSTNTPLQALVLMNDPQFVEAARVLADRTVKDGGATIEDRITYAFRLLTSRKPVADELAGLRTLLESEHESFRSDGQAARALLSVGDHPAGTSADPAELAAYAVVANTIMNFDAAVYKR